MSKFDQYSEMMKDFFKGSRKPSWWLIGIIIATTVIAVIITVFLGKRAYNESRLTALDQFNRQQLILARSTANSIETYFAEVSASLTKAVKLPSIRNMTPDGIEHLKSMYEGFLPRTSIRYIDGNGTLQFIYPSDSWRRKLIHRNYSHEPLFERGKRTGDLSVSGIIRNEQNQRRIRMSIPIYRTGGGKTGRAPFNGVLIASFDLDDISRVFIEPIVSGETGYAWLLNQDGYFIAHHEKDFVGKNAFTIRAEKSPELAFESINQIQRFVIAGHEGIGRYISGWHRGVAGRTEKLIAYSPAVVVHQPWSVAVVAPVSEVDRIIRSAAREAIYGFSFVLFILISAGAFLSISAYRWSYSLEREVKKQTRELKEAKDYLDNLIRSANAPIVVWDPEGVITIANRCFEQISGWSEDEIIGRPIDFLFPDESRSQALQEVRKLSRGEGNWECLEIPVQHKDGSRRTVLWNSYNTYAEDGKRVIATLAQGQDVTDRKQVEETLQKERDRAQKYLDVAEVMLVAIHSDQTVALINKKGCKVLGYREDEIIGKNWFDNFIPARIRDSVKSVFAQLMNGRVAAAEYFENPVLTKSGDERIIAWHNTTLTDDNSMIIGTLGSGEDITEQKRAEDQKQQLETQLRHAQKMETMGTLVAGVAHEINNPVNKILFDIPILQKIWRDALPDLRKLTEQFPGKKYGGLTYEFLEGNLPQLLSDMDLAANRVAKTVGNLKNFARQSSIIDRRPVRINDAVENSIRLIRMILKSKGIELKAILEDHLPLIEGDLNSIEQSIMNILINAIEAIDGPDGNIEITTGLRKRNRQVFVSISDNGRGVDPAIAEKIFDPFVTNKQNEGGIGLGLSITYNIVEAHGGNISFKSRAGGGTVFFLAFPSMQDNAVVNKL